MGEGRSHIQFISQSSVTTAEIVSLKGSFYLYINTGRGLYPKGLRNLSIILNSCHRTHQRLETSLLTRSKTLQKGTREQKKKKNLHRTS